MKTEKTAEAVRLLEKAQQILRQAENQNLKKANDYLQVSIRLIEQSRQQ